MTHSAQLEAGEDAPTPWNSYDGGASMKGRGELSPRSCESDHDPARRAEHRRTGSAQHGRRHGSEDCGPASTTSRASSWGCIGNGRWESAANRNRTGSAKVLAAPLR